MPCDAASFDLIASAVLVDGIYMGVGIGSGRPAKGPAEQVLGRSPVTLFEVRAIWRLRNSSAMRA
jgi:hypothetical protein